MDLHCIPCGAVLYIHAYHVYIHVYVYIYIHVYVHSHTVRP